MVLYETIVVFYTSDYVESGFVGDLIVIFLIELFSFGFIFQVSVSSPSDNSAEFGSPETLSGNSNILSKVELLSSLR